MNTFANLAVEPLSTRGLCLMSVDVEDWFHNNFRSAPKLATENLPRRVEAGVDRILEALAEARGTATFFVLGEVAEEHPHLVGRIAAAGHEIACHAHRHTLLYEQSPRQLAADLSRARELLRRQSGQPVLGFRAPSWSITRRSLWALDVVAESGFEYDSSIFPLDNYLYGIGDAPRTPYRVTTPTGNRLVEIPPSTLQLGSRTMGVGGGVYLRLLPFWLQERVLNRSLQHHAPFVAYTHPREFDPDSWPLKLPLRLEEQAIFRFGLARGERRMRRLLAGHTWRPLRDLLADAGQGDPPASAAQLRR